MAKRPVYLRHLKNSDSLVTSYEAIRAGFVSLALERNRRATPFVAQAKALKVAASVVNQAKDLLMISEIQPALLTAAGISDKAANYLLSTDKTRAIQELIQNFLEPAGASFVEELVFRFLLTRGDALGGSMRNVGGALAQRKLARALLAALGLTGKESSWLSSDNPQWRTVPKQNADMELTLRGLHWMNGKQPRTLLFNLTVPQVKNNIDLCLLRCKPAELSKELYLQPERYLAFGELKGGIDPAGADEHWKTGRTALIRIQLAFEKHAHSPHLFFIGAAIEKKMAGEIWQMLEHGSLENAANLTDENQLATIALWLCQL